MIAVLHDDFDDDFDPDMYDADSPATGETTDRGQQSSPDQSSSTDNPAPATTRFPSVYGFVTGHLSDLYRRDVSGQKVIWCPQWWAHGEAVSRLEALWRAWEHLRLDGGTGMAVWWKDYADPTMAVLFDPQGPFAGCSTDRGHKPRLLPLPCEPMPEGLIEWLMSDPDHRRDPVPAP